MISRVTGRLVSVEANIAVVEAPAGGLSYDVLVPSYLASRLASDVGRPVVLHTLQYLEAHGQGSSFVPRLLGFPRPEDRRFFEALTTVKGLGNRKALRALAREPSDVAAAIAAKDAKALQQLPEIGRRLAETIVAELSDRVAAFVSADAVRVREAAGSVERKDFSPAARDAVAALVALGESATDAERLVDEALRRSKEPPTSPDEIVAAAFGGRPL